jgi:hypothetical protein
MLVFKPLRTDREISSAAKNCFGGFKSMRKYFVLAMVVVLSLSIVVWAAETVKDTKATNAGNKGSIKSAQLPTINGREATQATPIDVPEKAKVERPEKAPVPKAPVTMLKSVNKQAVPAGQVPVIQAETPATGIAEKMATEKLLAPTRDDGSSVTDYYDKSGEPSREGAVLDMFQAPVEPEPAKWQPIYGEKGEITNPEPTINSVPSQGDEDIPIIQAETQIYFENFSNPQSWTPYAPPAGWTVTMEDGGQFWDNYDWTRYTSATWGVAFARNYSASASRMFDDWLISPAVDFSAATACSLAYRYYYDAPTAQPLRQQGEVLLSDDGGVTWPFNVVTYSAVDSGTLSVPKLARKDISAFAAGKSSIMVAYHTFRDTLLLGGYFGVDNVEFGADGVQLMYETMDAVGWGWQTGNASWVGPSAGWTARDFDETNAGWWNNNDWHGWYSTSALDTVADIFYIPDEFARDKMVTPSVNCTTYPYVHLRLKQFFDDASTANDTGYVLGTTDDWATTQTIAVYAGADVGTSALGTFDYDIASWAGGQSNVKVAFQWVGGLSTSSRSWVIGSVEFWTPSGTDVGTTAILVPPVLNTAGNWPIKSRVANYGGAAATFEDSTYIQMLNKNTLLFENFSNPAPWTGATPPVNILGSWAIIDSGSVPGTWNNNDWHSYYYSTWLDTVASIYYSPVETSKDWLISPVVDATARANVHLAFKVVYDDYTSANDTFFVYGSTDDFATKNLIAMYTTVDYGTTAAPAFPDYDISSWAAGSATVKIGFKYVGNNALRNYLDNVELYEALAPTVYYTGGATVTGLPVSASADATMSTTWNMPAAGTYQVRQFTALTGDENAANDLMVGNTTVYTHTGTGGPDLGYYSWIDNTVGGGPTFGWVDMTGSTAFTFSDADDGFTPMTYMGGTFFFYGNLYDSISASSNGFVTFLTGTSDATNYGIPSVSGAENMIAFMWDDMLLASVNGASYLNDVPNNRFVIQYDDIQFYTSTPSTDIFDAQIILDRDDWSITVQYNNFGTGLQYDATVGIENLAGDVGLQYFFDTDLGNYPYDGLAIRFLYTPPSRDVAVAEILAPTGLIVNDALFTPSVRIANNGAISETFDLVFRMYADPAHSEEYNETVLAITLGAGVQDTIDFPTTSFDINGAYSCSTFVGWTGSPDPNPVNDWLFSTFTVDQHYGEGGPDAGLYKWIDNTVVGGPTYSWIEINPDSGGGGTVLATTNGDDTAYKILFNLHNFPYYGTTYDSCWANYNGLISFGASSTAYTNTTLPNTATPNNIFAAFWDDWYYRYTIGSRFMYQNFATYTVVEWFNFAYGSTGLATLSFQAILYNNGEVVVQFKNVDGLANYQGSTATVGMENATGTSGLQYLFNGAAPLNMITNNLAIRYYIFQPAIDVASISFDSPLGGAVGQVYFPSVTVRNVGTTAAAADVTVKIVGPAPATDTVFNFMETTALIAGQTTQPFTFTVNSWTPAVAGGYTALVSVTTAGDEIASNNLATGSATILGAPITIPFATDFETNNGGFLGFSEWEYGIPTLAPPSGPNAHSPVNLWGTDLDSRYENSTLNSLYAPPLDLTAVPGALVKFWMWDSLESNYDGANVSISTDMGSTWAVVTTSVPYNDPSGHANAPGIALEPCWTGFFDWTEVVVDLGPYVGNIVLMRFDQSAEGSVVRAGMYVDDFSLEAPPPINVALESIAGQVGSAGSVPLCATFSNAGAGDGSTTVHFAVFNGTDTIFTTDGSGTIPGNGSATICGAVNWTAVAGDYTIYVFSTTTDDTSPGNDAGFSDITIVDGVAAYPMIEDFENVATVFPPAGWTVLHYGADGTPTGTWQESSIHSHSPTMAAFQDDDPNAAKDEWLVMQPIDFTAAYLPTWKFWELGNYFADYGTAHEYYAMSGPVFDINTATMIGQHLPLIHEVPTPVNGWAIGDNFDLNAYVGQSKVWLAVRYIGFYGDEWWIDDFSVRGPIQYDATVLSVDQPTAYTAGPDAAPIKVTVTNTGYSSYTFDVNVAITGSISGPVYTQTLAASNVNQDVPTQLTFPNFTPTCFEQYTVDVTCQGVGDEDPANDAFSSFFDVHNFGYRGYHDGTSGYVYPHYYGIDAHAAKYGVPAGTTANLHSAYMLFYKLGGDIAADLTPMIWGITPTGELDIANILWTGTPIHIGDIPGSQPPVIVDLSLTGLTPTTDFWFGYTTVANAPSIRTEGATGVLNYPDNERVRLGGNWLSLSDVWSTPGDLFMYVDYNIVTSYVDAASISIDSPAPAVIGLGPFDVIATVANGGMTDFTGASATVTITGPGGVDFTNTVPGINLLAGGDALVDFGDWTPTEGFVTYDIDVTVTVAGEQNPCNNSIAGTSYILLGTVESTADFEATDGGFVEVSSMGPSDVWQWGTDAATGAFSGTNVWGTKLNANYDSASCSSLRVPAFTVPQDGGAIAFYAWYEVETAWDYCNVKISTDGGTNFNVLNPIGGYDSQEANGPGNVCPLLEGQFGFSNEDPSKQSWNLKVFTLEGYEGASAIISIDFAADGFYHVYGFYLDNFMVVSFPPSGCDYVVGDINGNGSANGIDVTFGVSYFKGGTPPPVDCGTPVGPCDVASPFYAAGDVNGNCAFNGIDITFYVAYLKGLQPALRWCETCAPVNPPAIPAVEGPGLKSRNVNATGGTQ